MGVWGARVRRRSVDVRLKQISGSALVKQISAFISLLLMSAQDVASRRGPGPNSPLRKARRNRGCSALFLRNWSARSKSENTHNIHTLFISIGFDHIWQS